MEVALNDVGDIWPNHTLKQERELCTNSWDVLHLYNRTKNGFLIF